MVRANIDRGVGGVGEVGTLEMSITEQRPFEITQAKVRFLKCSVTKINLFGSTLPHHQPFQIQTEKVAVIEDALTKTDRIGIQQTLPIRHRPIDPDHLARDEIDIAHFATGEFHEAQITVFETAFREFAGRKKGLTKITRDEGAVIKFGFENLFTMQINTLEFFGEYVHVVRYHH